MSRSIWATLGIGATRDRDAIRRAYARRLRVTNPEDDPEGFMALREAYDMALARAGWPEPVDSGFEVAAEIVSLVLPPAARDADAPEARAVDAPDAPEVSGPAEIDLGAARAAEVADLGQRRDRLLALLRSPWAAASDTLRAEFDGIVGHPMLAEIGVRAGTEDWLAHVIAGHAPRADPLVGAAMAAFGWDDDIGSRRRSGAIDAVRQRAAELDFVAANAQPGGVFYAGWLALTRPPGAAWRARLVALLSERVPAVRAILATADNALPGIADWFDPAAERWWREYFSRERVGGLWLMLPILATLVAALLAENNPGAALVVFIAGIATPFAVVRFIKQPQREWQEEERDRPAWHWQGWMAGLAFLPLLAAALPATGPALLVVTAAALFVLGWTTVATPLRQDIPFWHRVGGILRTAWPLGIYGAVTLPGLPFGGGLGWSIVSLTLVIAWWRGGDAIAAVAGRWLPRHPAKIVMLVAAAVLIAGIALAPDDPAAARERLTGFFAVSMAVILVYLANRLLAPEKSRLSLALGAIGLSILAIAIIGQAAGVDRTGDAPPPAPAIACPIDDRVSRQPGIAFMPLACDPGAWIPPDGYPAEARRLGLEGAVAMRLSVDARGRVTDCLVVESSKSKLLDDTSCALVKERGRFLPALDAEGQPRAAEAFQRMRWQLR